MALRALKTEEEIAGIPLDQPILIELPGAGEPETEKKPELDESAKTLQDQLEALQAANKAFEERERAASERAAKAERDAAQARRDAEDARKRQNDLESDVITGGLTAAQAERDAAKQALQQAGEAGDWKAIADAQSRIGRAEAKILTFESGAAEVAERKERQPEPKQEQQIQRPADPMAAIDANPNLLPAEREWLKAHPDAVLDTSRNNELSVGYQRAMKKGLVRGTPAYFAELEDFMGYKQPDTQERETSVQAPVTPKERGGDGRPSNGRVTLTPEQRDLAKNMGISEIEYARQVANFDAARRADPDRYK